MKSHTCPPHRPVDVHYCGLNVLSCHLHSELKDVACTITTQQAPTESAQELCSGSESNCEAHTRSGNPAGRSQLEKVTWSFSTRVLHLPNWGKKQLTALSPLWELTSAHLLFQPNPLEIISHVWTNPVVGKVNNAVTSQTSWFNR